MGAPGRVGRSDSDRVRDRLNHARGTEPATGPLDMTRSLDTRLLHSDPPEPSEASRITACFMRVGALSDTSAVVVVGYKEILKTKTKIKPNSCVHLNSNLSKRWTQPLRSLGLSPINLSQHVTCCCVDQQMRPTMSKILKQQSQGLSKWHSMGTKNQ